MKQVAATPVAFVRAMVLAYEKYGKDPDAALRQAQITPELLCLPNGRITASQMETISGLAMLELDDEALGWFSRRLPWGSYGMLCRASLTSPTLGVALKRWCRHHRLLTDDLVHRLTETGGVAELVIEETRDLGPMREFCLITSLRFVIGYACWLINSRIALDETAFAFDAPLHSDVYPLLFSPGPVALQLRLDRISLRCALSEPCATARRAVDDCDAEAPAAADRVEVPPRPAPGPAGARTLEARPPFGRFAGGRTQPFSAHSLPAAPRGRHIAPGPKG